MIHALPGHRFVPEPKRTLYQIAERVLARVTDHFVVGSEALRSEAIDQYRLLPEQIDCIPYALDIERYDRSLMDSESARRELAIPREAEVLLLLGRLEEQKGVDSFLELVARLSRNRPNLQALVVGDGPLRSMLEERRFQLGLLEIVTFLGWRKDIGRVMGAADVLVIPSRWEAFGIVNLEAMASRKPVAGYAVEGIPEVVLNGETGLLVPAGSLSELCVVVERLLDNAELRHRLGTAGRVRVEQQFSVTRMVNDHIRLYERLLQPASR
jgi:glycosyltransferase involved in cell wall biosynthesis